MLKSGWWARRKSLLLFWRAARFCVRCFNISRCSVRDPPAGILRWGLWFLDHPTHTGRFITRRPMMLQIEPRIKSALRG